MSTTPRKRKSATRIPRVSRKPRTVRPAEGNATFTSLPRALLWGTLTGVIVLFLSAFLLAATALKFAQAGGQVPIFPFALLAVALCGFLSAIVAALCAARNGGNPFLSGLTSGALLLALLAVASLMVKNGELSVLQRISPALVLVIASLLGSFAASMHRPNRKRRLKKLTAGRR